MSKPILLDSNIIIYSGLSAHNELRQWLKLKDIAVSLISKLEVLGYHSLIEKDKIYFETFFRKCRLIEIDSAIIDSAINLKQLKSMSLGDSIVAATAMQYNFSLVTANDKDFKQIEKLKLINPLAL